MPAGVTVDDIYRSEEYEEYLEDFSLDLFASVTDDAEEEHLPISPKYTVTDTNYSYQSYLNYLHMENVWEQYKGDGITVAVIDTGIDTDHPEFAGKISEYSYNATEDKIVNDYCDWSLIEDEQGHGTAVAGVIAASMDGAGTVGIAPNVTLVVIKCQCDLFGRFLRTSDLVFGLYYAIERDVDVVNMSFGCSLNAFEDALLLAVDSDVICVAAAGNEATSSLTYPAADSNCIGVGALADNSWELASYSNFGENSDIVAPGTVYTTALGGGYSVINGTSFASPITAASIALLRQQNWNMEYEDVVELLKASSYDLGGLGEDFYYGFGALDISALILEERGKITFDMLTDELEDLEYVFIRNHTLQNIPEPERLYSIFDGWYYDIHVQDELNWYSDVFTTDITMYANWANEDDGVPYTYIVLDDGTVEICSYTGHRRYITVPEKIEDRVVSSIGDFCFADETRLREINLPETIKNIGLNAFANCTNLTKMSIPDSVQVIGAYTFMNNARLYEVSFGSNSQLTTIGDFAFQNCGLISFEVPQNLITLNGSAFCGCTSLMRFTVRNQNAAFIAIDGVLYNSSKSTLIAYPAGKSSVAFEVFDETTHIGTCAFAYSKIKSVDLAQVQYIDDSAFTVSSLQSLDMPDTVLAVGKGAFLWCGYLSDVKLSRNLTQIEGGTFAYCGSLSSINIPKNVQFLFYDATFGGAFQESSLKIVEFESNSQLAFIDSCVFEKNDINSINIPKGVLSIGYDAFALNYNLKSVTFEEGSVLKAIYGGANSESAKLGAFYYCASLKSIALPESLETIGAFAFENSGLTEVTIPKNVSEFGVGAFASCHDLQNIYVDDANKNYIDIDGVVYTTDKFEIVEYPAGRNIDTYKVNSKTTKIGDCAFYGSHKLSSVGLSQNLITVGEFGFYGCQNIITYNLLESLTYIEKYAFAENTGLQYISIPDNVMLISNYAFKNDYSCYDIHLNDTSKLTRISFAAFANTGIWQFRIPQNVSVIAQYAFEGCDDLNYVTFAANSKLESVSAYMFGGAKNINSITFENGSDLTSIQAHGFEGMAKLINVDFGDAKLINIDNYAFRYCESLESLNIPDTVENIGRYAFYGDVNLQVLNIPTSVKSIGRYAFNLADSLKLYFLGDSLPVNLQENWDYGIAAYYVDVDKVLTSGDWEYAKLKSGNIAIIKYKGNSSSIDLTTLNLGGKITQIGGHAFEYSEIISIKLPNSLEMIQRYAFSQSKIEKISIPANVTFIGQYAFYGTPIKSLTFSSDSKLYKVEQFGFANTKQLKAVSLPKSLTVLESYAFYESGIESVNFSSNCKITTINPHAFASTALVSVTIPNGVNYIDDNAFRDCLSLQTVTLGTATNLQIHANAFYNTGLSTINIPANVEYIGEYAFVGLQNLSEYNVDAENAWYKSVDGVLYSKDGKKIIAFPANRTGNFTVPKTVETIGFGAFENSKLSKVEFADGINLLTIGYRAFYNSDHLKEISIPASVISIDYYAFAMCGNLETVTFANNNCLTGIYEGAFYSDKSLKNIVIPDSIVEISDYAFYGCSSLNEIPVSDTNELKGIYSYAFAYTGINGEVTISDTVVDIGDYAFLGTNMTKFVIKTQGDSVKRLLIGIGVLKDCKKLTDIDIPFTGASYKDDVINWYGYIFGAGSVDGNVTYIPKSLKNISIGSCYGSWYMIFREHCFDYAENVILPEGLEDIDYNAFSECINLNSVVVSEGVTTIGGWAFYKCTNLVSVSLPNGLERIEGSAFNECSNLIEINIPQTVNYIGGWTFVNCLKLESISIPESVEIIEYYTFGNCINLRQVEIPEGVLTIEDFAFTGCTKLESITIPNNVTKIGNWAFSNCENIKNITIPEGISTINQGTFTGCKLLNNVTIPNSVTSIGIEAFSGCESLATITIPENVTYIGDGAFRSCYNIKNIVIPNGVAKINDYTFSDCRNLESIVIPDTVKEIGIWAFYNCNSINSITIPEGVISIGEYAFYACSSLDDIVIPKAVSTIGNNAFACCTSLTSIVIPEKVTAIESLTFAGCSNLVNITIPDSVTDIGLSAFNGCYWLNSINLPNSLISIGDYAFCNSGISKLIIPEGTKTIGESAFSSCSNLISVTIPESVESIGKEAFYYNWRLLVIYNNSSIDIQFEDNSPFYTDNNLKVICNGCDYTYREDELTYTITEDGFFFQTNGEQCKLKAYLGDKEEVTLPDDYNGKPYELFEFCGAKRVIIPDTFTEISNNAFWSNQIIESVTIPDTVKLIGYGAFYECINLQNIVLPDSLETISDTAFYGCTGLTEISIPNSVTSIRYSAFCGCSGLTNINIPDSLITLGESAFAGTKINDITIGNNHNFTLYKGILYNADLTTIFYSYYGLTEIEFPSGMEFIPSHCMLNNDTITSVVIPDGTERIFWEAFSGCSNLVKVVLPDSLKEIGWNAFSGCTKLQDISISKNVTTIGSQAFSNCTSLKSIVIPSGVQSIEYGTFYNCSNLESIVIPDTVTFINGSAFENCCNLKNMTIPNGVQCIYWSTFMNCSSIEIVKIPQTVKSIESNAFNGCTCLKSISLPNSIESIGESAFEGCANLVDVVIPSNVTSIGSYAFSGCSGINKISIPNGIKIIDSCVFDGCSSLTNVELPKDLTTIGSGAFRSCCSLTEIVIPESVKAIGAEAFSGCTNLVSVNIPKSITTIEDGTFNCCRFLAKINIPSGVTIIGNSAFNACETLTEIRLPDVLTSIGNYAFSSCNNIICINIPDSVTSIGEGAFFDCQNLTNVVLPSGIKKIENFTFYNCNNIVDVTIPGGVSKIGDYAFGWCAKLANISIPDSVTTIGAWAFAGCGMQKIILPDGVKDIGENAFSNSNALVYVSIPESVESIGKEAFYYNYQLTLVENKSKIELSLTDEYYFYKENNIKMLIDSSGVHYAENENNCIYTLTNDKFLFCTTDEEHQLLAYLGDNETVTLPFDFNGESYRIYSFRGASHIIIPNTIARIDWYAFGGSTTLKSVIIPDSVTTIEQYAFGGCINLADVIIPDTVTSIGENVFYNTQYYNDKNNWQDGCLYNGRHLIAVESDVERLVVKQDTISIASSAFEKCTKLRELTIGVSNYGSLAGASNLETLIFTNIDEDIEIRGFWNSWQFPITLKNIVLKSGCNIKYQYVFNYASGISIFVEEPELSLRWDHDYSGWNNNNPVYYDGEWISCEFYDTNGNWIDTHYQSVQQIIRQPYVTDVVDETNRYIFVGWDINGDGLVDCIPATSTKDIVAKAVMKEVDNLCTVTFYNFDGSVLSTEKLLYGETIKLPQNPTKKGYTFNGWKNYSTDFKVTDDIDFYGIWTHNGNGHEYITTKVEATCEHQGYDKHVCAICGDEYHDNYTDALEHQYGDWVMVEKASCKKSGSRYHICSLCHEKEYETIEPLGHEYDIVEEISATCTHTGHISYKCKHCDSVYEETTTILEHKYEKKVVDKSALEWLIENLSTIFYGYAGNKVFYYQCEDCGYVMTFDDSVRTASANSTTCNHIIDDWEECKSTDCDGCIMIKRCSKCGDVVEAKIIEAVKHIIAWVVDGREIKENYVYGATPSFKGSTEKSADVQYTYTFTGWDKEIVEVTENVTYTAQYSKKVNSYTVTWVVNGKETEETYDYGSVPEFKGSTEKPASAQYTYKFDGWDKEVVAVTGDVTYTAKYTSSRILKHILIHYPAKEATNTEDGNIEYWYCSDCDKYYSDSEGKKEITKESTVIPKLIQTGDVNGDSVINSDDAIYTLRYVMNPSGYSVNQAVDFNNDGKINSDDAIYLLRHVMNPAAYPIG